MNETFVPKKQLENFMKDGAMNSQYGVQVYLRLDAEKAQALLPPPLKVVMTDGGALGYIYVVNIREPTFGPWYMEGGLGVMAEYNGIQGLHFMGLMLSGPGALMGMCSGREGSGLPKKLCERIHVERFDDRGHCWIERNGVRLLDVKLKMGSANEAMMEQYTSDKAGCSRENPATTGGGCLLFRYQLRGGAFKNMEMLKYESPTRFYAWDTASAEVALTSTADDPWGDLPVTGVIGAGWMVSDNWVTSLDVVHTYPDDEPMEVMQYLFSGRYDRCTLGREHQTYE